MKNTTDNEESHIDNDTPVNEMSENKKNTPTEQDKLDAVRDLLFGQNVKEYREEIQEVKTLLKSTQSGTDLSINEVKAELSKKIDLLSEQFEKRNKQLEKDLEALSRSKVDAKSLANLLKEIAAKLESNA